jgi:hypothetical protein
MGNGKEVGDEVEHRAEIATAVISHTSCHLLIVHTTV